MHRSVTRALVALIALAVVAAAVPSIEAAGPVKNVIVMVPDGCSTSIQTLARWYKGEPLAIDPHATGSMATYMSNSVITGSAAAATAFATGTKTTARFIGVGPRPDDLLEGEEAPEHLQYAPLATVLEGAKLQGMATGLVATSRITHATPAAYAAHIHDRGMDNEIMEHIVYNMVDVVFGGGGRHLLPSDLGGRRTDSQDLQADLVNRGYQFVETRDELMALSAGKVWGMFASSHMAADFDRAHVAQTEPSIAEMTAKAIELLSQDPDGFFLMVEGSQIDWAGHANDPAYMVTDFIAFDDAFKVAYDFAVADGETLIVAFPDHNTGAMSVGNDATDGSYTSVTIDDMVGPLRGMTCSSWTLSTFIGEDTSAANVKAMVSEYWGLEFTDDDIALLNAKLDSGMSLDYALAEVASTNHTYIGWTTNGHSGEDVPVWSYGPRRIFGGIDNTQIAKRIAGMLGFSLDPVRNLLFVDLADYVEYELDMTDPENPVAVAGDVTLETSKDILHVTSLDLDIAMPSVTVYAPETGKVYASMVAVALIDGFNGASKSAEINAELDRLIDELDVDPQLLPAQLQ
jgi:alkaline phosphatase